MEGGLDIPYRDTPGVPSVATYPACNRLAVRRLPVVTFFNTETSAMHFDLLIPITLFVCVAYAIKTVVEAYTRRRIIESRGSEELVRSLLEGESTRRRLASLHWGCVFVTLAAGFGLVELLDADRVTPGVIALLLGATGLGNLGYYLLERKLK